MNMTYFSALDGERSRQEQCDSVRYASHSYDPTLKSAGMQECWDTTADTSG